MTAGVVLMTYGAPRDASEVGPYLARVRGGRDAPPELVAEFVGRYERIGWSPLVRRTEEQARALAAAIGPGHRVAAGMRFSAPTIAEAVAAVGDVERLVGVVLSPQFSPLLMGGYARALEDAAAPLGIPVTLAGAWHREPAFIEALAVLAREAGAMDRGDVPVVFTAHSLPRRVFSAEPAYVAQLRETAELVADRVGLPPGRWHWAYQSAGHTAEEWLRPDLIELLPSLAEGGAREVLVVPVQFLSDHLEVLYDLDVAAAEQARRCGLRYRRIEMPGARPEIIAALAAVARRSLEGWVSGPI